MSKKMLINATHPEENRVAIVEDGILTELDIEIAGKEQTKGNIYKAAVVRVEPGLQAAFIDYGAERFGFLQMGEIHPSYFRNADDGGDSRRQRITDVLRRGQELLVQVVKEERGTKGAALTTFLSLPGRYMVLMPESDTKGVSRKIEDDPQRKKLKEAMASLELPPNMGYIVRTAGIGQKKEELKRDFDYLVRVYENIQNHARKVKAPALIYKESNLAIRSIRDYFSSEMDEVLVDDPKVADEAREFFQQVMPEYARLVKMHQERRPIFSRYQIEEQIETITKNKVQLPSGGSIVIDPTEALVSVDVNSGKMAGEQGVESTAYKTNLEAAAEVARQLRLRDLGGLIVIDFIDMRERKHIREVEKCLKDSLKNDKARVTVGRISQFGLLEMSRQRIKAALAEGSFLPCPHCNGSGKVKSAEAQAVAFLRKVHAAVAKGQIGRVEGEIPLEVATYLLNLKREELVDMERRHQMVMVIKGRPDFLPGQAEITVSRREKDKEEYPPELAERPIPVPHPSSESTIPAPPLEITSLPEEESAGPIPQIAEASSADTVEEAAKKKRRRRRKRKKPEDAGAAASEAPEGATEEELGEDAGEESGHQAEEEVLLSDEDRGGAADETPAQAEERRKKKRRRRRKKPAPSVVAEEAAVTEETAGAPLEETPQEGSEIPPAAAASEPSREAVEPSAEAAGQPDAVVERAPHAGEEPGSAPAVLTAEERLPVPSEETPPAEKPKAARPRRRTRRKSESASAAAPGEAPQHTEETAAPPPAPEATAEPASEGTPSQDTEPPAEQPPKTPRRRSPRRKAAATTEAETTREGQAPTPEEATPEKPKPRPRKRKATAPAEGELPQDAEAKEKKPRRRSKKPAEETTEQ